MAVSQARQIDGESARGSGSGARAVVLVIAAAAVLLTAAAIAVSLRAGSAPSPMVGIVAAPGTVSVVATDQLGAQTELVVERVEVPGPSWVVVYSEGMDGMAGRMVGRAAVPAGRSVDVRVPLDTTGRLSEYAVVVVQADRGVRGVFEFDEARFEDSPDKPYWAGGEPVQTRVWVRFYEMSNSFRS